MFENTFTGARTRREVAGKLKVLPMALAIHALAIGFVLVTQLWAVSEVPEPYTLVAIYVPPPLPAAPAKPPGTGANPPREHRPTAHGADVAPSVVPTESAKARPPDEPNDETGVIGGFGEGGNETGPPGGVGPGTAPVTSVVEGPEAPRTLSPEMQPPVAIYRPAPAYPELARTVRRQGTVIIEAVIDRQGNVVDARVLRDVGLGLGEAALQAVRTWRYRPATLDGRPVTVYLTVTINFELHGAS